MFRLLFFSLVGQIITGDHDYSQELKDRLQPEICVVEYLGNGQFIEAFFETGRVSFCLSAHSRFCLFSCGKRVRQNPNQS
jgi:hypothetical protein